MLLSLAGLGLASLVGDRTFLEWMGGIGGVLLVLLGLVVLGKGFKPASLKGAVPAYHPFSGGVLFSTVLNPAVPIWWMTVGLTTLAGSVADAGLAGGGLWLAGHFLADIAWYSGVSASVHRGRNVVGSGFYRALLLGCGLTLLAFGLRFTYKYLPELLQGLS